MYESQFAYLREQARTGSLTSDNRILQEMEGKDNLPEVRVVLNEVKPKIKS
jgi:hypothetical protein